MEVSGVRSSWETLAIKSRRVFSMRSVSVKSRSTATAPPPGMGAAVTSKVRPARDGVRARGGDHMVAGGLLNGGQKIRIANAVN